MGAAKQGCWCGVIRVLAPPKSPLSRSSKLNSSVLSRVRDPVLLLFFPASRHKLQRKLFCRGMIGPSIHRLSSLTTTVPFYPVETWNPAQ